MHEELAKQFDLSGRVAVVTGAASGIGQGVALVLAQAGARVVVADIDESGMRDTLKRVTDAGGSAIARRTDVSDPADIDALGAQIMASDGQVDVWVNAAGLIVLRSIMDAVPDELRRVMDVNLAGVYWGCSTAGRAMRQRGSGSIINLSSTGADAPAPGLSIYSLTKAAVNMITRTAAVEFGPHGIRVNAVAPGFVETPMTTYRYRDADGRIDEAVRAAVLKDRAQGSPLGITGTPQDIGLMVLYLAADASRYVTGQVLRPNGGVSMP